MKYHQFVPDPEAISARIAGDEAARATMAHGTAPAPPEREPAALAEVPATLEALTALRDRAFIEAAYRRVLGRDADPDGCEHRLLALRSGAVDKVDILGELRDSPEGRARAVDIPGLGWRYSVRRIGRVPVIGWFLRSLEAALRLPTLLRVAQRHQAAIELASVEADTHANAIRRIQKRLATMDAMVGDALSRLDAAEGELRELRDAADTLRDDADVFRAEASSFLSRLAATEHRFEGRHQRLAAAMERMTSQVEGTSVSRAEASDVLDPPPPEPARAAARGKAGTPARTLPQDDFDAFYLEFEDRFRGSREDTKRRQETYLAYVEAAGAGTQSAPVLDVGCGRGEWLELLKERGYVGRGVDQNRVMIAGDETLGLEVVHSDVLAYLSGLRDESIGMVTGFHIIEHLPFDELIRLFDQARRVLRPGGCAIFETPNPENLVVSGYTFYLDPTHRHPLPPQMTEFLAWQRGFADVEIVRLHPRGERGSDQVLLDRWFRNETDYAVIGWKDRKGAAPG